MRWKVVVGNLGSILKVFGLAFFIPVIPALVYSEPFNAVVFLFMAFFTISLGYPAEKFGRPEDFHHNEAIVLVSFTWIVLALISAVPFVLTGLFSNIIDAFFESMSGITTTGATLLTEELISSDLAQHGVDYSALGHTSTLLWRAVLQWLGGMGIIVLSVAILSKLSSGGMRLLEAEAPGPTVTRLKPKIKETAKTLWYIYCLFTLILAILLLGVGLHPYDAVYHSFTTLPTGGFSPYAESIGEAAVFSAAAQWIFIIFMIIAGVNFSLHYQGFFKHDFKKIFSNSEFKTYLALIFGATGLIALIGASQGISVRDSLFQTASLMTTTGYTTETFAGWSPQVLRLILLMLMFVGGSAGSTGGGMKVMRILIVFKMIKRKFKQVINPRRVEVVRMGDAVIDEGTLENIAMFFSAYMILFAIGSFVLVWDTGDMMTGISASATSLGNVGPALGKVASDFLEVGRGGRLFSALLMWIGRLEIFTAVVLFNPSLYKKRRLRNLLSFDIKR